MDGINFFPVVQQKVVDVAALAPFSARLWTIEKLHRQLVAEDQQNFLKRKDSSDFRRVLQCPRSKVFVAYLDGKAVGMACLNIIEGFGGAQRLGLIGRCSGNRTLANQFAGPVAVVSSFGVLRDYQGRGTASDLMQAVRRELTKHPKMPIFAQVNCENERAKNFFTRKGFSKVSQWRSQIARCLMCG